MALRVSKPRRAATKKRVKSEDFGGRGAGVKPYEWLRREPTIEETRARRGHRKLPPLPYLAAPQEFHQRKLRGGRPAGVRAALEKRLRRAFDEDREEVRLHREDVRALVELYDRIEGKSNPSVMWLRAGVRGIVSRVEQLEGELEEERGVGRLRERRLRKRLREIAEHGREVLREDEEGDGGANG